MTRRQDFIQRMLFEGFVILVLAFALSLTFNQFRNDRLPLVSGISENGAGDPLHTDETVISLADARALYDEGRVQFLDARSFDDYDAGHIRSAINLPWQEFDAHIETVLPQLRDDATIVAYCDGEACNLSKDLAEALKAMGFDRVKVLVNGWSLWRNAGLPTAGGPS